MSASSICSSLKAFSTRRFSSKERGAREARRQVLHELVAPAQRALPPAVQHRQQVLGLAPQEVLPQEGARPQQPRQLAQPPGRRQQRQRVARSRGGQHLVDELRERAQRRGGVGGERDEVRELLEQRDGGAQRGELLRVLDPPPVAGRDQEEVKHLVADARDLDLVHVDAAHRERRGERVEEAGRVRAAHLHPREALMRLVVEADLERLERHGGGLGAREALRQPAVEAVARLVGTALPDERQQLAEVALEVALELRGRARSALSGPHPKLVHDQAARGRRAGGRSRRRQPPPAPEQLPGRGRRAGGRRVDVAGLDVERRRGEQAADERELGEEIEPDDRDVEPSAGALADPHARGARRAELGGERVVQRDLGARVAGRVVGAHALHELADCPVVFAHTPPRAIAPRRKV